MIQKYNLILATKDYWHGLLPWISKWELWKYRVLQNSNKASSRINAAVTLDLCCAWLSKIRMSSSRSKIWIRARTNWRLVTAVKHVLWWPNYSTWLSTQEDNSRLEWLWRILGFKYSKNEDKIRYYSQLTTYAVKFGYKSKPILRWYKVHEHQYYTTISLVPYMAA